MPLTKQNVSVFQASLCVVLVASRLCAEAKAEWGKSFIAWGRSPAQRVQESKTGRKTVQKAEKQGQTSGEQAHNSS